MKSSNRFALLATVVVALSSLSTGAMAASATGTANAQVLAPIAITAGTALNFGTIAGNTAGSVTVTPGGARSFTGGVVGTAAAFTAGTFNVTGTGAATFAMTYPASFNVVSGANTMAVTVTGAATGTLSGGAVTFPVGGTLTVGAAQAAGAYAGTYSMTVEYN